MMSVERWPDRIWEPRDRRRIAKARHWRAFKAPLLLGRWGLEPRCGKLESDALAYPRVAAEPLFVEIHGPFETLDFREPYQTREVQSFRDRWALRRIMSAPCREGVRSLKGEIAAAIGTYLHINSLGEDTVSAGLAEEEELGSNLLHVS